eukprot:Nitzschia sp. Nitz4//NODE_389_length_21930_cov_67.393920//595//5144//NITZ4_additional_000048-RA//-1//CDS//3329531868//557//frame0
MADEASSSSSSLSTRKGNHVQVYLRLRPMNKLEESRRSKDCVELQEDPTKVTVDAPLQGLFDYTFDAVLDDIATQQEVYQLTQLSAIPKHLLSGVNCTLLAYGQSNSGKSHLLLGSDPLGSDASSDHQGMVPRMVEALFQQVAAQVPSSTECTIKFSMVELYLEHFTDLLRPVRLGKDETEDEFSTSWSGFDDDDNAPEENGASHKEPSSSKEPQQIWVDSRSDLLGASELCCLQPDDIHKAIRRGNSFRTQSATEQNKESTRSHLIMQWRVEQIDRVNNTVCNATLRVVSLAGSEFGRSSSSSSSKSSEKNTTPMAVEGRMLSASLQSLNSYVRAKLAQQQQTSSSQRSSSRHSPQSYANVSKLTKLLRSSLDGPCYTTLVLTASRSSVSIAETLHTLQFGSKVRQLTVLPIVPRRSSSSSSSHNRLSVPFRDVPSLLQQADLRVEHLTRFVRLLAVECRTVRKTGKIKQPHAVWDVISRIAKSTVEGQEDVSDLTISIVKKDAKPVDTAAEEVERQAKKIQELQQSRTKAESSIKDYQSEVTTLRAEAEVLKRERSRMERELQETKDELKAARMENSELDRKLRTSQFRESEAVIFARQFRSFYLRLLKSKAAHGNGDLTKTINDYTKDVPSAADLVEMLDIDKVMVASGMIETTEVGHDTNASDYTPSVEASNMSAEQADLAQQKEIELLQKFAPNGKLGSTDLAVYRHKLVETPAGKLALNKERDLEHDIIELSTKCIGLQNTVDAEKAMVEALSSRQGALGKMKAAQEMAGMKSELERKTNDMQAIIWKMNELHLVNKTINQKVENRENQVSSMEERLSSLETRNHQLESDRRETEKKYQEENEHLQNQLQGFMTKMWQFGEEDPKQQLYSKLIVPVNGETLNLDNRASKTDRRISVGDIADEGIVLLKPPPDALDETGPLSKVETSECETQTDPVLIDVVDSTTQTDPVSVGDVVTKETSSVQTDTTSLTSLDASMQTDGSVRFVEDSLEIGCQTDEPEEEAGVAEGVDVATADTQEPESNKADMSSKPVAEAAEKGIQTHTELTFDAGVQTLESEPLSLSPLTSEMSVQTDHQDSPDTGMSVLSEERGMQTEALHTTICFEASTQTDDLPTELALQISKSSMSFASGWQDNDSTSRAVKFERSKERVLGKKESNSTDSYHYFHSSNSSLGSFHSLNIENSPKSTEGRPTVSMDTRLGMSMSAIQAPTHKVVDWRAKLRQKEDTSSPHIQFNPPNQRRKSIGFAAPPPKPPPTPSTMMSKHHQAAIPTTTTVVTTQSEEINPLLMKDQQALKVPQSPVAGTKGKNPPASPDGRMPEWMQRFNEMGIKRDENDYKEMEEHGAKSFSGGLSHTPAPVQSKGYQEPPKFSPTLQRRNSMGADLTRNTTTTIDLGASHSSSGDWMEKFNQFSKKKDEKHVEPATQTTDEELSASTTKLSDPDSKANSNPEWMTRFKQIGQKQPETVTVGTKTVRNDTP